MPFPIQTLMGMFSRAVALIAGPSPEIVEIAKVRSEAAGDPTTVQADLTALCHGGAAAPSGPSFAWFNAPLRESAADKVLQRWFGPSVTTNSMIRSLMTDVDDLKVRAVYMGRYLGILRIEFQFGDVGGGMVGRFVNKFVMDEEAGDGQLLVAEDGQIELNPDLRGRGIGMRLLMNFIEWRRETGRVSQIRFRAEKMGAIAWSRFAGLSVSKGHVTRIKGCLAGFNRDYGLRISPQAIERLGSVGEIGRLVLSEEPPQAFVEIVRAAYCHCGLSLSSGELLLRARRVGDVALLLTGYNVHLDLRAGADEVERFRRSVSDRFNRSR